MIFMKKFCDNCLKDVSCKYYENNILESIDGIEITYVEKCYICDTCGEKFYDDLLDYNVLEVNNKLREKTSLITIEEIQEILNKYSIGKKPLSLVLDLGEVTISRYLSGSNPSKENSDLLKNIYKRPLLMEMYLKKNKELISNIAYKKTLGKISQITLVEENSKLYQCAIYILGKIKDITPLSLQKILYFIDGFSIPILGKKMFLSNPQAWPFGPVYSDIYDCFSYYKKDNIDFEEIFKDSVSELSDEEKVLVDNVIDSFACYSGGMLIDMSHLTMPWKNARIGLNEEEISSRIIETKDINDYFNNICKEKNIDEICLYAQELFNEVKRNKNISKR